MKKTKLMLGDNIESLKKLPDNSIDSVVTDPPYGLSFMNKKWDYDVPSVDFWKEVYRVLKPGGHILSFGGTRTYHRMVVNIEDAGFEIRDQIQWIYGSGFPKSHNIGKAVDKLEGNEREIVGYIPQFPDGTRGATYRGQANINNVTGGFTSKDTTTNGLKPVYKKNNEFEGWGTALKPANEPICVARKPLSEKSVAENVLKWGTGGINVDGCRVGSDVRNNGSSLRDIRKGSIDAQISSTRERLEREDSIVEGRFPANIILECICDDSISHDDPNCPCRLLDEQSGESKSSKRGSELNKKGYKGDLYTPSNTDYRDDNTYSDKGGASRFFYQAKVSKAERNMGLDGFEDKIKTSLQVNMADGVIPETHSRFSSVVKNSHPTVKPINLMAYLCRLITPEGGIVLDPFMGSGSTGVAAQLEGFRFVGMEMDPEYFKIASARIDSYEKYSKFHKGDQGLKNGNTRMASRSENSNSMGLGICKKKEN